MSFIACSCAGRALVVIVLTMASCSPYLVTANSVEVRTVLAKVRVRDALRKLDTAEKRRQELEMLMRDPEFVQLADLLLGIVEARDD